MWISQCAILLTIAIKFTKGYSMRKFPITGGALLLTFLAGICTADTLELADGTILEGDFVGSSNGIVMFNTGDSVEAYPEDQVVGIFLSEGVATAQAMQAAPSRPALYVPAGTRLFAWSTRSIQSGMVPAISFVVSLKEPLLPMARRWFHEGRFYMGQLRQPATLAEWLAALRTKRF